MEEARSTRFLEVLYLVGRHIGLLLKILPDKNLSRQFPTFGSLYNLLDPHNALCRLAV